MFLLSPTIFPWDLAISMIIGTCIGLTTVSIAYRRKAPRTCRMRRFLARFVGFMATVIGLVVIYGSFIEPQIMVVTTKTVPFPSRHPIRVVVLSDMHVGPYKGQAYMERVVRKTNDLLPDIVLLAGDFVLSDHIGSAELNALEPLKDIHSTYGTYAILGNHDHDVHRMFFHIPYTPQDQSQYLLAALHSFGITTLRNSNIKVNLGTETIAIAGIDDITAGDSDLDLALKNIDPDMPLILMAHNPDVILDTLSAKANLIVAGHTHGGQIRLPFYGPIAALPTKLGRKYDQGVFPIDDNTTLAITRGIGESGPRARLFAWPEIMQLTLMPSGVFNPMTGSGETNY